MIENQATKDAKIIQIGAARGFTAKADQAVANVEIQLFGGTEVPVQGHDNVALVGKDRIDEIHRPFLCATNAEAWEDMENG